MQIFPGFESNLVSKVSDNPGGLIKSRFQRLSLGIAQHSLIVLTITAG